MLIRDDENSCSLQKPIAAQPPYNAQIQTPQIPPHQSKKRKLEGVPMQVLRHRRDLPPPIQTPGMLKVYYLVSGDKLNSTSRISWRWLRAFLNYNNATRKNQPSRALPHRCNKLSGISGWVEKWGLSSDTLSKVIHAKEGWQRHVLLK